jgi:hypothetical protein
MNSERFQTEPATHTLDLRAEFKQFFYKGFALARTRSCAKMTQGPFVMGE